MNALSAGLLLAALAVPALAAGSEPTVETTLLLATQRIAARDFAGAERALADAEKRWPAAHGIHLRKGALEEARGNVRAALYEYQWELLRAGADRPSGEEAMQRSTALVDAGSKDALGVRAVLEAMAAAGQDPKAALDAVRAARKGGDAFVLRVFEAELRESEGDPEVEALFRHLVKTDPYFVPAQLGLARVLSRAGKEDEARATLEKARTIDPDHWSLRL